MENIQKTLADYINQQKRLEFKIESIRSLLLANKEIISPIEIQLHTYKKELKITRDKITKSKK